MIAGDWSELYDFQEFQAEKIQARLEDYFINAFYPVMAQAFILQKPAHSRVASGRHDSNA